MANERVILCGDLTSTRDDEGTVVTPGREPVLLRLWGAQPSVNLKVRHISDQLSKILPGRFLDLLELATYVYCADQAVKRGGDADVAGEEWRRQLRFAVPVRDPDFWRSADVADSLRTTLGFLSEDEYHFDFQPLTNAPGQQHYLEGMDRVEAGTEPEEVVLFSGGLDSLGGAVQEAVLDRRRVTLVTHRSTTKLNTRQGHLHALLNARAGPTVPRYVPVTVNKDKRLGREYTQRSRSFLYACLAATVAELQGLNRIRFYENGVVSLNLPLAPQVVGARATRTTHPRVLAGFRQILSLVAGRPFGVENPFLWKTKAEVVKLIAGAGCGETIRHSTSCTHTWEMRAPQFHCGHCSQCIDRRFAVLAAGQAANDPADGYKVDLLAGARDPGEHRTLLASYVESASAVERMDPIAFYARYGEVARVVRHLDVATADQAALRVFELYQRHAVSVGQVVEEGIAKYNHQIRNRSLPDDCLLRLVCDTSAANGQVIHRAVAGEREPSGPALAVADNTFRRKGQYWVVRFGGGQEQIVEPMRGMSYLYLLLSTPGKVHAAVDLVLSEVRQSHLAASVGDAGPRTDREAVDAYRQKYADLQEQLSVAERNHDAAATGRLKHALKSLAGELKSRGLGGRPQRDASGGTRLRQSFQVAVKRAIEAIGRYDANLAGHLQSTVRCGQNPTYQPAQPIDWDL